MKYLSVNDVCEILHIGRDNAYKLFNKKNFPSISIGRKMVVEESSFNDYMKKYEYSKIIFS